VGFWEFVLVLAIGVPLANAVARRIASRPSQDGAKLQQVVEHVEQRLDDSDHRVGEVLDRLAEVEERLDSAERLLARHSSRDQLGP
jgi:hypothetical protein